MLVMVVMISIKLLQYPAAGEAESAVSAQCKVQQGPG